MDPRQRVVGLVDHGGDLGDAGERGEPALPPAGEVLVDDLEAAQGGLVHAALRRERQGVQWHEAIERARRRAAREPRERGGVARRHVADAPRGAGLVPPEEDGAIVDPRRFNQPGLELGDLAAVIARHFIARRELREAAVRVPRDLDEQALEAGHEPRDGLRAERALAVDDRAAEARRPIPELP